MPDYPNKLPGFTFREPDDDGDKKLLSNIQEYGWHVVGIPDDDEGPGFCFTVGIYLRTLQPEILMMGVPIELCHRVLNAIAEYLMAGGTITPGMRYPDFAGGRELMFSSIHQTQFHEYLGCANWFYLSAGASFPALQCIWPDPQGKFPDEEGFDPRFEGRQIDLSIPHKPATESR